MPRFQSGGGYDAVMQLLMQREEQRRQQLIDELTQRRTDADIRRGEEGIKLQLGQQDIQREQERRIAEEQRQTREGAEQQREFQRASTIASNALPGDPVDDQTRQVLERHGFGGQVRKVPGILQQGPLQSVDEQDIPTYAVEQTPDQFTMRGGSTYLGQRAAAAEREATAAANRQAADERGDEANQMRLLLAQIAAGGKADSAELANELKRLQIQQAQGKIDDAAATEDRSITNATRTAQDTLDLLNKLATFNPDGTVSLNPGTANLFGAQNPFARLAPGSKTATASADLDRLRSRAIVDLLNEMKSQSKTGATGFGAMNEREFGVLEGGATTLGKPLISDEAAAEELRRLYDIAQRVITDNAGRKKTTGGGTGGADEWTVVNGRRVRRKQ